MTIIPYFDPLLGKLRNSDVALISLASITDPFIVNNLQVLSNASLNNVYTNSLNVSSTASINLVRANGVVASTATLGLTHISSIDWNLTSGSTLITEGQMNWDANQQTVVVGMPGGNVDLALGMETLFPRRVRNSTGSTMPKGTVVYINGVSGNTPTVDRAIATGDMTSAYTLGMTAETINDGSTGWVATFGELTGIDLSSFTGGDTLYLSGATAGLFTNTPQLAPYHYVRVGTVVKATTDGALVVNVINGYELNELHNVVISSLASGQILQSGASSLWYNRSLASAVADLNVLASLGSLAYLNSVTQEYLPSTASFTNLYTTDIQTGGLAVTSTASVRNLNATNILAGNASISGALNVGNIFGLNFLGVASTLIAETGIITNVLSTDVSNTSNISTNTLYANIISGGTYLNLPSLGSLAQQNTVDYTQITNFPSLGSLAIISDVEAPLNLSGVTLSLSIASISHNSLGDLTNSDPHTQYVYWAGRSGGQLITGGTGNNQGLVFRANTGSSNTLTANAFEWLAGNGGNTQIMELQQDGALGINTGVTTARLQLANGVNAVAGYNNAFELTHNINKTTGTDFIGANFNVIDVAGGVKTIYAHRAKVIFQAFPATTLSGMQATSNQMVVEGGNRVEFAEVLTSNFEVKDTSSVGEARLIRLFAPNVASTASIGTLIGLEIPALTQGGVNWSIYSNGGTMYHAGQILAGLATTTSPAYSFYEDSTTGMYYNDTIVSLDFAVSGSLDLRLTDSQVLVGNGNSAVPVYSFYNDPDTGMFSSAANILQFATNGGEAMRVNANNILSVNGTVATSQANITNANGTNRGTLTLDQNNDASRFIRFEGTESATNTTPISSDALGAFAWKVRVQINNRATSYWIPVYLD